MRVWLRSGVAIAASFILSSCTGWQSALNAQAIQAEEIRRILLIFVAVATVVWVGVMLTLCFGLLRRKRRSERPLDLHEGFERRAAGVILVAGIATTITVLALSVVSYGAQRTVFGNEPNPVTVKITGHQWWWEVEYQADSPHLSFTTANEIRVPGRPAGHGRARIRRRHPQLLGPESHRQDGPDHRASRTRFNLRRKRRAFIAANAPSFADCSTRTWHLQSSRCRPTNSGAGAISKTRAPPARTIRSAIQGEQLFRATRLRALPRHSRHACRRSAWPRPDPHRQPGDDRGRYAAAELRQSRRVDRRSRNISSPAISCRRCRCSPTN